MRREKHILIMEIGIVLIVKIKMIFLSKI